jgi:hypothetical protein
VDIFEDDYGWQDYSSLAPSAIKEGEVTDPARQHCYCGADACSGFLGGKKEKKDKEKKLPLVNVKKSKKSKAISKGFATAKPGKSVAVLAKVLKAKSKALSVRLGATKSKSETVKTVQQVTSVIRTVSVT